MKYLNQNRYDHIPYAQFMDRPDDPYGKFGSVRDAGCGLCCACMMVDRLTTKTFTVKESALLSHACGGNHDDGTDMKVFAPVVAEKFNLDYKPSNDINEAIDAVRDGGCVIVLSGGNRPDHKAIFSRGGHYVLLISATKDEVCVVDPNFRDTKYAPWVEKGEVRVDGIFVYASAERLDADAKRNDTRYYIFRRKGAK